MKFTSVMSASCAAFICGACLVLSGCGGGGGSSGGGSGLAASNPAGGSGAGNGGSGSGNGSSGPTGCAAYPYSGDQAICSENSFIASGALSVRVSQSPSSANQPITVMPTDGSPATIYLSAVATNNFVPVSYSWTQVKPAIDSYAATGAAVFAAQTKSPSLQVSLPKPGTYQFQLSATDASSRVLQSYVWVQAWDSAPALGPNNIGRNPGIAPPTSVRPLTADPGPFNHPRLLFSKGDWPQLTAKSSGSASLPGAVSALASLNSGLASNFDKPGSAMSGLEAALTKYAADGYSAADYASIVSTYGLSASSVPSLFHSNVMADYPASNFSDALAVASYIAWLSVDPSKTLDPSTAPVKRLQTLGMLTAAWSNFLLQAEIANPAAFTNSSSGSLANYSLALAYDLTFDAMTSAQQAATQSYLYTIGNLYNTGGGGISITKNKTNPPSSAQNGGDFPNLADGPLYASLVIEGEEGQVAEAVLTNPIFGQYIAASQSTDPAVTPISSWPNANQASVRNLGRQVRGNSEYNLTPWGFYHTMSGYFHLGQNISAPASLALARRGENQWVTTNLYQALLQQLYNLVPAEGGGTMGILDHQDSSGFANGDGERNFYYIAKFMYPDDPMVDFVYQQAIAGWNSNLLTKAIFAAPLLNNTLAQMAQAKQLGLMKFDPLIGFAISRNSWNENDLNLVMQNFTLGSGHYHAEANTFALSALGRVWANPPGYHITPGDAQQQVLIQTHPGATDASEGYIGQGPGSYDFATGDGLTQPPFHGVLLDIEEDPSHQWSWFSGDAAPAYSFSSGTTAGLAVSTGLTNSYMLIPGMLNTLIPSDAASLAGSTQFATAIPYNPVSYAFRSILTVRGANPYVLIIDDMKKDGATHNYRWTMNNSVDFGGSSGVFIDANKISQFSSLEISPGATATEAVLYHDIDAGSASGLPRLLVRDVSEQSTTGQPAIVIDNRPSVSSPNASTNLTYGVDNNSGIFSYFPTRRLFIDRKNIVSPEYKVLLFPYLTGGTVPVTSWDATKTILTVKVGSQTDTISFDDSNPDHRTRLKSFARTGG